MEKQNGFLVWQNRKRKFNRKLQRFKKLWRKVKDREDKETIQEQEKSKNWNGEKSEKKKHAETKKKNKGERMNKGKN